LIRSVGAVESNDDVNVWHRTFAVAAFNRSWDLIDRVDRSPGEDAELLSAVFASRFHWEAIGNDENKVVGDWQIAHAASHLDLPQIAMSFATAALERAQATGRTDWLLASCYEGVARAHAIAGDTNERDRHIELARAVLETVDDPEDRELIESQLNTIP
jgi:hypothetical protein